MISRKDIAGEWYHGDLNNTDFKTRKMDVEDFTRDRNAMGPGIYFTRSESFAKGYTKPDKSSGIKTTGYLYTVTMNLDPKRVMEDKTKPDEAKLRKFIDMAPDKEGLYNYGENLDDAVEQAVKLNMESSVSMLEAVMGVYNDLYQRDSRAFARAMVAIGYDAFLHKINNSLFYEPGTVHLIVYNPDAIHTEEIKKINEHISLFEEFTSKKKPNIWYHGSNKKFDEFSYADNKTYYEFDIYSWFFSKDMEYVERYGEYMYTVDLSVKNTFDTRIKKHYDMFIKVLHELEYDKEKIDNILDEQWYNDLPYWTNGDAFYAAVSLGFDSIFIQEELEEEQISIAVFDRDKIKILSVEKI